MKPYMIQYPIAHPNYGKLQTPIARNNNLVKNNVCAAIKQGGGSNEQNSKGMQPRWCPSGLSRTQKKEITTDAKARINGAIYSGHTGKVSN
jgi:hypothetical protein